MNTGETFDVEMQLKKLALERPSHLDLTPIDADHIAWTVSALEGAGLHPSLIHMRRVLGRGTNRSLLPLVNEFYRTVGTRPEETSVSFAPDDVVRELFAVVSKRVRKDLMSEFTNELERIRDAQAAADEANAEARAKLASAEERMIATQALSDGLRHELDEGRNERTALQGRLDQAITDLAQARQSLEDSNVRLNEVRGEKNHLADHVDELLRECAQLGAAAVTADESFRRAEERAATATTEAARRHEIASENEKLLKVEQGRSKMLGKRVDELSKLNTRLGDQLNDAKSRLTRQRTINNELEKRSHSVSGELAETKRKLNLSHRQLAKTQEQVIRRVTEVKSIREQLSKSTQETRQLRTACSRMEGERQRLMQRPVSPSNS